MKQRLIILITTTLFFPLRSYAQLSIEYCYERAKANYPLIKRYELIEKSKDYDLSNAGKGYLPQLQLSASASYQSEVTKIPVDIPGVGGLSKDQYGAKLELNQVLWDGGVIRSKRETIRTRAEVDRKNTEAALYPLRDKVNQLYFGIILYNAMIDQNITYQSELQNNYDQISAYMRNGIADQADMDAVRVEQLKAGQTRTQLICDRNAYLYMLALFIGEPLNENTELQRPQAAVMPEPYIRRPELAYYDALFNDLNAGRREINSAIMPKLGFFITGGYGRPGLNMLESKFSAYYTGGVRLSWNFGNYYTRQNSLNLIEVNKNSINNQLETFLFNTNVDVAGKQSEIGKIRKIIKSDNEIIRLRTSVKESAKVKVANGTMSVTDLVHEVNAEQSAKQDKILHELQLLQAIYDLKYIVNQ